MRVKHRSFLKWAGGKYRLIEHIRPYLPQKKCLIEPFVGAGSVFLNTEYERYILADANPDLINLFNTIKYDVENYIDSARALFEHPQANTKTFYLAKRAEFNRSHDIFQRSVLFLYLNRFGFNGLCRYNRKHEFNVPFGSYKKHYFPEKELRFFAQKAKQAVFICADFVETFELIRQNSKDCAVYCDPPYAPLSQESNFTNYTSGVFGLTQQRCLAEQAKTLSKDFAIPVIISNHDTPFTREIYQGATLKTLQVQRSISQKGSGRVKVGELVALFN